MVDYPYPMRPCVYGYPDATVSIALVGNSHASQWLPTLQTLAEENHWKVTSFTANGCSPRSPPQPLPLGAAVQPCLAWGRNVQQATMGGAFDLVVFSDLTSVGNRGRTTPPEPPAFLAAKQAGYETYLRTWAAGGTRVLVLRDTPFPRATGIFVPECLGSHDSSADCGGPRSAWLRPDPLFHAAQHIGSPTVTTADLTDVMCGGTWCSPVVGGAIVFFDGSHMTSTFAKTLAPAVLPHIQDSLAGERKR